MQINPDIHPRSLVSESAGAATQCPLCGCANGCQLCPTAAGTGSCWCMVANIPDELLARVPAAARNQACLCAACVAAFHSRQTEGRSSTAPVFCLPALRMGGARETTTSCGADSPGDFYFEAGGLRVFTAAYHQRRGYCCGSGCRHCPYPEAK